MIATSETGFSFQIGDNSGATLDISNSEMRANALGKGASGEVADLSPVKITATGKGFDENIKVIDQAIKEVSACRTFSIRHMAKPFRLYNQ